MNADVHRSQALITACTTGEKIVKTRYEANKPLFCKQSKEIESFVHYGAYAIKEKNTRCSMKNRRRPPTDHHV